MRILVMNTGSSSLKSELVEANGGEMTRQARVTVSRIGPSASVKTESHASSREDSLSVTSHAQAARVVIEGMRSLGLFDRGNPDAVGHRIIHGGERYSSPVLVDDDVISDIQRVNELAPLHNERALETLAATRSFFGPDMPMVAVFDTAFHHGLPPRSSQYAIPRDLAQKHSIRRYGFHGLAHRYLMERYCELQARRPEAVKLVTLQLGNGCSATAIRGGRSVDTSMGFTPLEGLVMGTRSGDIDPSLITFLAAREQTDAGTVEGWLNTRSGLLGISGRSADMRELVQSARQGNGDSSLAVELFCYRAKKYIGAYLAALDGAEAVVFGGGIGENLPEIRAGICRDMDWCGLHVDDSLNQGAAGREACISPKDSRIQAWVIPVNEAVVIARDTLACLVRTGVPT